MVKRYRSKKSTTGAKKKSKKAKPKTSASAVKVQMGRGTSTTLWIPPKSLTPNFGGPFGQVFETELNYADYFSLNPSIGGSSSYQFMANDLYDPNHSGTGHQPHGYDQLITLYSNWQVLSSTIEVVLFPGITTTQLISGSGPVIADLMGSTISLCVRDTAVSMASAFLTMTDILERPGMVTKFVNSNNSPTSIRTSFSVPKFYGRTRGMDDAEITGYTSQPPTDGVYYHVILCNPNGTVDIPSHTLNVRIKYKCRFFNPRNLSQS